MGARSAGETEFQLSLADRLEEVEQAAGRAEAALRSAEVHEDVVFAVGLAVREAVGNAVRYTADNRPGRSVEVEFRLLDAWVEIEVRDEGGGFDPDSVADPLAPENLLKPSGRGLFLMRQAMDEVDIQSREGHGTTVKMKKRLGGEA